MASVRVVDDGFTSLLVSLMPIPKYLADNGRYYFALVVCIFSRDSFSLMLCLIYFFPHYRW